ncbi:hypothetical protein COU18_01525 [Candidatus Kaiserbacteria bacterium CG10_big_fil_rev_8_21_14_0_10_51_14]|uniref:Penicillin-binding protein transpeptidase domain-containing protein n=1 Tax=Candidatus Kaiserbacteria bacterium CG10_big_fil_rev_8_21_14_0_10_51_14 TaxID=1974610 RepID=A0A2H0UCB0_9BACT|nr:MAG: hypothetical protein COU18_01525 [Candidatus Kaiserbacteria bacterium CG10_big_fil_rev_8_21_14_0_10_51_14]
MTRWFRTKRAHEIAPDEIFLDSSNLPLHETSQFEGRVVSRLSRSAPRWVGLAFFLIVLVFGVRVFSLEILKGETYAHISRENTLERSILFTTRGLIMDRTGTKLAWNEISADAASSTFFALRKYTSAPGLAHLLGFIQYPKADKSGVWWREEYAGMSGSELAFNDLVRGANGNRMVERDALGVLQRENIVTPVIHGKDLVLSVDAKVQSTLYTMLSAHAKAQRFEGGAAVIMDVHTGEILALTSFPEYDNQAQTDGIGSAIRAASENPQKPLLNRAISGLYVPGSIVKPIFAAAALNEGIITPEKEILSTGAISVPNPYDPDKPTIFRDWTVHGLVDMRTALAVSSDEYFYTIGGGYESQKGLGIEKLDEYARRFGLSQPTGIALRGEAEGVIPTPEWKVEVFGPDDPWRIGNTYHTAIGQYGFQITPLQAVVFTAAIANGGKVLVPKLVASSTTEFKSVHIPDSHLQVVREGMRLAVTSKRSDATVKVLNMSGMQIAAKTGTAQLGLKNERMNSWSVGFWPSDHPRYAYAVVLEHAPAGTLSGAAPGLRPFFEWLAANHPEYIE